MIDEGFNCRVYTFITLFEDYIISFTFFLYYFKPEHKRSWKCCAIRFSVAQTCFNNNPLPSHPPNSPLILRQMWALSWKGGNLSANWSSFTGEVFLALVVYSCWLPTPTSCSYNWDDQPVLCLECLPSHQEETSPKASWWLNWGNCLIHWSNQCLSLRLQSAPSGSLMVPFFLFFHSGL